jgi:hypothetical protein
MTQNKYRGKDENGKWVYGNLIQDDKGECIIVPFDYDAYIYNGALCIESWAVVKPETVGKYADLKDCDENPIYDGDIIDYVVGEYRESKNDPWKPKIERFVVKFDKCAFRPIEHLSLASAYLQIVGNIHDNPELLTTKTE